MKYSHKPLAVGPHWYKACLLVPIHFSFCCNQRRSSPIRAFMRMDFRRCCPFAIWPHHSKQACLSGAICQPGGISKTKGRIDTVFANAGVGEFVPFGAVTEEHFDKLFNINVRGTLFTVQKALPLLKDGGSIILNGSVASVKGTAAFGVYAASKAAIRSFVRTWTTDLKDRCIRSNVVSPGPINTPLANRLASEVIARIVSTIPMGRMGEPEEVAKVALFLASDDSSFVTGIELFVDGGRAQI